MLYCMSLVSSFGIILENVWCVYHSTYARDYKRAKDLYNINLETLYMYIYFLLFMATDERLN